MNVPEPERYVCACFSGMTYKKYLYHIDVNRNDTDPQLFAALQAEYHARRPFWRRLPTLCSLSRVDYFEFKVYYDNMVTIKEDWRDRFPRGHGAGEWSYVPTKRDTTPYLSDEVLTHFTMNPSHLGPCSTYFWNRIPKKMNTPLVCALDDSAPNKDPFKVGWGLYFIEEFSPLYLLLMLLPLLILGVVLALWYCERYKRSFADGATVVSAFAAVVVYLFSVAQGWGRPRSFH